MPRLKKEEREEAQKKAQRLYVSHGLTQEELASMIGVSKTTINTWSVNGKWEKQKEVANLTPERLQAECLSEINKILEHTPEYNEDGDIENPIDYKKVEMIQKLYKIYSDLAKEKGDLAQYMVGFLQVADWLTILGRIEEAKQVNLIHDEFVKSHI